MENKLNSEREYEYDFMRAFAAVAVVCIHTCATRWRSIDVYSTNWLIITIYHMLCKFSVPLFFMISGRFCLDAKRSSSAVYITKKILRLAIAFLFWSLLYTFKRIIETDAALDEWKILIIKFFAGEFHMWFLFVIASLYLITPLLKPISLNEKLCKYFLVLFFIFQFLLPFLSNIPHIGMFATEFIEKSQMKFVVGYSGYYIFGSYLSNHSLSIKKRIFCYVFGLAGTIYSIVVVIYMSHTAGKVDESLAEYLTWNVAAEAFAVYVFILQMFKDRHYKIVSAISKYSFGIYLSHPFVLWIFSWLGFMPNFINPIVGVPIVTIAALVVSLVVSMILRKMPLLGKVVT